MHGAHLPYESSSFARRHITGARKVSDQTDIRALNCLLNADMPCAALKEARQCIEDMLADVARYRYLRDGPLDENGMHRADLIYMQHRHGEELDQAIDVAILRECLKDQPSGDNS
jgi:hypothetical protein